MSKKLLIVESPNKIKKIKSFLDLNEWDVAASAGHIRDLPSNDIGVSPPEFKPIYVIDKKKSKLISSLRQKIKQSDLVYLATDPDREGEAIAWHLADYFKIKSPIRITFTEITEKAISSSLKNKTLIDMDLVKAQEARRVLDRIVGYTISPILTQKSGIPLSAGRVQSPAVKIIVLREKEITQFRKRNHYSIKIKINDIEAELQTSDFSKDGEKLIFDENIIKLIKEKTNNVEIISIETKEHSIPPLPPLNTSTLQQLAHKNLGYSPNKTMKVAQELFEKGLISYHRTDSLNFSQETFEDICNYWRKKNIETQKEKMTWKSKDGAQEAHEAIKPTYLDDIEGGENQDQKKLYKLIRDRALLTVLPFGIDVKTQLIAKTTNTIETSTSVSQAKFTANTKIIKDLGWRSELENTIEKQKISFDSLKKGENFIVSPVILNKQTEPPKRFNEATLIKALEILGIGRPSTYASILENIKKRNYIKIVKNNLEPTKIGIHLIDSLDEMSFMNLEFTKIVESKLDEIAQKRSSYFNLVNHVHNTIEKEKGMIKIPLLIETSECPKCLMPLKKITANKNTFWVHVDSDHADSCVKYISDKNGTPTIEKTFISKCPACSKDIKKITANKNTFWVHVDSDHADSCVKYISDKNGTPVKK